MLNIDLNGRFGQFISQGKCDPYEHYKAFYIHVPKCGGSSINTTLAKQNSTIIPGHTSALAFRRKNPKKFEKYYKFAHIRNPLDRLISAFFFGLTGRVHEQFYMNLVGGITDFSKYVEAVYSNFHTLINSEVICPQTPFITDECGNILVDDLFLFEDIVTSWDIICKKIGCPDPIIHKNSTTHMPYYQYYTDKTINMVYELYKMDFNIYESVAFKNIHSGSTSDLSMING